MAKQTRAQRRARRQAQQTAPPSGPARRPPTRDGGDGAGRPGGQPRGPGGGRFVSESWAELKKVEWPGQPQLIQGTVVVLIACVIVGTFLWLADLVSKPFVQNILLGQ